MTNLSQILIISPESWDSGFVSKHHYAITLASNNHLVYFLDPPVDHLKKFRIKKTKYPNLWCINGPLVAKGLRFYPKILRNFIENRWLKLLETKIGRKFTTVWLFENSRFYDLNFAGNRLKIYHQVDLNQKFHFPKAAITANICFCTTDFIKRKLIRYNEKTYKIHHGVSIPLTNQLLTETQNDFFKINIINSVYVGNLDISYLNINLLSSLIRQFSKVQFHLVGKYEENGELFICCSDCKNITWWGQVASEIIPAILTRCDIQLLTYEAKDKWEIQQLASPHKMMEYLASGKVTVSTYTDEYKDKRHLLEMVDDSKDYFTIFEKVINNLSYFNSLEKQIERIEFANNNSYFKQLETIEAYLKQHDLHF